MNKGVCFVFTDFLPNNIDNGYEAIFKENKDIIRCVKWGKEICPKTKKLHNQGFIQMYKQCRFSMIQKLFKSKCHFEVMHGTLEQNNDYCGKDGVLKSCGNWVTRGFRSDLHNIKDDLKDGATLYDIMDNYTGDFVRYHGGIAKMKELIDKKQAPKWRDLNVEIWVGEAGSGKSRGVFEKYGHDNVFKISNGCDPKFRFNGYDNEKVLLIDDFNGWMKYSEMLTVLDGHRERLNVKNGFTYAKWETVIITSNAKPAEWYNNGIKDNFKRRIHKCLQVSKGNTEPLLNPYERSYEEEY